MKTLILIPCFNTHQYIEDLLKGIRNNTNNDILIYDDGSSPSLEIDKSSFKGVNILRNNINKGKGYVLLKGFKYAIKNNYTHILTIDSDLQHNPNEINRFINLNYEVDFALGCRKLSKPMPIHRILSNTLTSFIISTLKNKKIKDSQCGFRRYKTSSINIESFNEYGYLFETELLLNNIHEKSKIENVPISTIYNDSKSSINNVGDTVKFIKVIMRYIVA